MQAMPDPPKNHSLTVAARCGPGAYASHPIARRIAPSRSRLVASRARMQAMPESPEKSLPYGRGSLRAARVCKPCPIPRKITPLRSRLVTGRRVCKPCPNRPKNHSLTVADRCGPGAYASHARSPEKSLPYGRGSLRAGRVCKPSDRPKNRSLTVAARCEPRAYASHARIARKITPLRSRLVAGRARMQAMPDPPKNHSLTVAARYGPGRLQANPESPEKSLPYGRGSLRAGRVCKPCPIPRKITPLRSRLVAGRARMQAIRSPEESLPHGRGSLRAARVCQPCPNRPKNHSLTVAARCGPRAYASHARSPEKSLPYGRGSLRAGAYASHARIARKITPLRSRIVAGRARMQAMPDPPKNHSLTVAARCGPRAYASHARSPEKSLPYGRGSLRAARVCKPCPIARNITPL